MQADKFTDFLHHLIVPQPIIRPQKIDIIARRPPDSLIHRVVNPLIRFTDPIGNLILIFSYNIHRAVRRTPINDDILNMRIHLPYDAQNGLLDGSSSVV